MKHNGRYFLTRLQLLACILLLCLNSSYFVACDRHAPSQDGQSIRVGSKALQQQINARLKELGSSYRPRTRHINSDGSAKYTNRLVLESSPYLLQHAHNPVEWHPWSDEAFETAKRQKKPILLSIGYSTCHWCHVMEEESFEDEEIATFLNEHYISIKVDREERPDIDAIYMSAVQKLSGRGGWPMTVWLTPDGKPFYGGTYFPPRDGVRGKRIGLLSLLKRLHGFYEKDRNRIHESSDQLADAIQEMMMPKAAPSIETARIIPETLKTYRKRFDPDYGGLRGAPKFPSSLPIRLLLRHSSNPNQAKLKEMATLTLRRMAAGGLYDQIGGGFHRYSTDPMWLVPHFEKMLYDNALLSITYLEAYQKTKDAEFARIVHETLSYVAREMRASTGGFYSAMDADSLSPTGERNEGYYFTWTPQEISQTLEPSDRLLASKFYGITEAGNFEGRSILTAASSYDAFARMQGGDIQATTRRLANIKTLLLTAREKRERPLQDNKILTGWNGLMISAFARAAMVFEDDAYLQQAISAAQFILGQSQNVKGKLYRSYREGRAYLNAYAEDYAFMIQASLDVFEATGDAHWLRKAIQLDRSLYQWFEDKLQGGYFITAHDHEKLLARPRTNRDGAIPSADSVAAMNLLRLHQWTLQMDYLQRYERIVHAHGQTLKKRPTDLADLLLAIDFQQSNPSEVIIVSPNPKLARSNPLARLFRKQFRPNYVVVSPTEAAINESIIKLLPALAGKHAMQGKPTAYVCQQGACQLPTTNTKALLRQLQRS